MNICETSEYHVGRYTVQQRPRPDNPAFAVYVVFCGPRLIGKSFSMPDEGCCLWLEHSNGCYALPSATPRRHSINGKNGHPKL